MEFAESKTYFEIAAPTQFDRLDCLKDFLKKLCFLPLALFYKAYLTFFRGIGLLLGLGLLLVTLGGSRGFFVDRVSMMAKDLADWVLLPFAVLGCFFKLILAFLIHPSFYFNC